MFLIVLFTITLIVFGFMGWLALTVAKSADEEVEGSRLTKNQWRAMAWLVAVLVCLVAALIEYKIILGN
ncbi:MAG: hypothetical protein PWP23_1403 [Candidatus Sumerlaeota bacterium]|nr:hypothetical protein [Candidatus Sumerlaeota bacterium]